MTTKMSTLADNLSTVAGKVGSNHPGGGAFGKVGEALGGRLGDTVSSMGKHLQSVASGAQGAATKLRKTVAAIEQNESHNAQLFSKIHGGGPTPHTRSDPPGGPHPHGTGHSDSASNGSNTHPPNTGGTGNAHGGHQPANGSTNGAASPHHNPGAAGNPSWYNPPAYGGHGRPINPAPPHTLQPPPPPFDSPQHGPTASELQNMGRWWHGNVHIQPGGRPEAQQAAANLNQAMHGAGNFPHAMRPGWQAYDPYVPNAGTYSNHVNQIVNDGSGGVQSASQLHSWANGHTPFNQLPGNLQQLAMITNFAEIGRGDWGAAQNFNHHMGQIANMTPQEATAHWGNINHWFPPSMTATQDGRT